MQQLFIMTYIFKKILGFSIALIITFSSIAQNEYNIWYFGKNAGVNFNSSAPAALNDGAMNTSEGCSSVADSNGNLLCYSNGVTLWNSNHEVMTNGDNLSGHTSATQSSIIVQKPGSTITYYIFTNNTDAVVSDYNGLYYSEIDFTSGLGEVTANKNVPLTTIRSEKLAAVKHANGEHMWIISLNTDNGEFNAFLITENGVNTVPKVSNVGIVIGPGQFDGIGQVKIAPDGKKLTVANFSSRTALLCDFNNATGQVTQPRSLNMPDPRTTSGTGRNVYGTAFSPNSNVLYVAQDIEIFQFDLTSNDIESSVTSLPIETNGLVKSLQLGPDDKIYGAVGSASSLMVINKPNLIGSDCDLDLDGIPLNGAISYSGLPNIPVCPPIIEEEMDTSEILGFYVPNSFSPNNDGINDTFKPITAIEIAEYQLQIYDRWGSVIYVTNDIEQSWNGKTDNRLAPPGQYSVKITYTNALNNETKELIQTLHLLR